jgi:hypothetical protein
MAWCERKRIGYLFGLAGNAVLLRRVGGLAEDAALGRVDGEGEKVRRYGDFRYAATSWKVERRVIAASRPDPKAPTAASHRDPPLSLRRSMIGPRQPLSNGCPAQPEFDQAGDRDPSATRGDRRAYRGVTHPFRDLALRAGPYFNVEV